jgi:hypothetical protein
MNIREAIKEIAGYQQERNLFAKVVSVDLSAKTCKVNTLEDEMDIFDVRLIANSGDGLFIFPSIDSIVGVCMINEIEGYVSLYSQIDSIQYGDGSFEGMVKVPELTSKLNALEDKVNDMISVFNSHIHTATGSTAPTTPPTTNQSPTISVTSQSEIENDKITHGDF